jgi:hypothetical protein
MLNPQAKPGTWFHELMHYMFDTYADAIQRGVATESMAQDFQKLLEFAEFKGDFAAYQAAPRDQQRVIHETVSYAWEQWLYEGKAHPPQYIRMFRAIKQFFTDTWKSVEEINKTYKIETGRDLPGMTDEIRQVFNRMVAGESQAKMGRGDAGGCALVPEP